MEKVFPVFSQFPDTSSEWKRASSVASLRSARHLRRPGRVHWTLYVESEGPPLRVGPSVRPAQAASTTDTSSCHRPHRDPWLVCRILRDTLRNKKQ